MHPRPHFDCSTNLPMTQDENLFTDCPRPNTAS